MVDEKQLREAAKKTVKRDDVKYVIGLPNHKNDMEVVALINGKAATMTYPFKPETKSIHMEDMLDSDGKKIFASLDRDKGTGGDVLHCKGKDYKVRILRSGLWELYDSDNIGWDLMIYLSQLKVIGIKKWEIY